MIFIRRQVIGSLLSIAAIGLLLAQTPVAPSPADLPSEADLPGEQQTTDELPGEEALPGTTDTAKDDLPDEGQIPGGVRETGDGAAADATAPLGNQRPILRLAFDGHTGIVRTLALGDGGRTLVSAGEDKDVHVWRRTEIGETGWLHRRTIRWPVNRGPRGRIYAARLRDDLVAFAGNGAYASNGEIRVVDVASGKLERTLVDVQHGHLQNVISLDWSIDEAPKLASIDMDGKLVVWSANETTGLWAPKTLVEADAITYGQANADALKQGNRRGLAPVAFVGSRYLFAPRYVGVAQNDANWHLQRIDLQDDRSVVISNQDHIRHVRWLSATRDGLALASCDIATVAVWKFDNTGAVVSFQNFTPSRPPLFAELSSDGTRVMVGTEVSYDEDDPQARLQLWDIAPETPTLLSEVALNENVLAGVLDENNRELLVTQGQHVEIFGFDDQGQIDPVGKRLVSAEKTYERVAFSRIPGSYQIALGSRGADGQPEFVDVFDPSDVKLLGRGPIDANDYLPYQRLESSWGIGMGPPLRLFEGPESRGVLPLSPELHGQPTSVCTLTEPPAENEGGDGAVCVGTNGQCNVYVYRANANDPPTLLRQFRGHSGAVLSMSTSADGQYLVSSAADATISIWNLQDIFAATESVNRWGCDFEIESGELLAGNVREDGPLYFQGVRSGDQLVLIEWTDVNGKSFAESNAQTIRERLLNLPFDTQVTFRFQRLNRPGPQFNSFAAWRPLATLFIDDAREWAFWTPSGYYDASFNGHQRFGWQINNNVDQAVDYFRAAQFRKLLERPDVMQRLLAAGSLSEAMHQTVAQIGAPNGDEAIVNQIQNKPTIRLISPQPGTPISGDRLTVRAEITAPVGATLVDPKAFVSGVPAVDRRVVQTDVDAGDERTQTNTTTYQWSFRLPQDSTLQLEILAATEAEAIERLLIDFVHTPGNAPRVKPRLHVLAIGVSNYGDPQIQSLDFAAGAADQVSKIFRDRASGLYRTSSDELVDADATRPLWRVFAENVTRQLGATVSPDDLVIMYLCGHGLRDRQTNQWYFVTADARFSDLMNDRYDDCIAFSDLAALSQLPCRKLAILDSCHSGAVQPLMRREDLKSALRFLQDDVVLTITASEGDEEAAEQRETRLGRFTATLVDGLNGQADQAGNADGTVVLTELIDYVSRRVAEESEAEGMPQHPTASPSYLLRTLRLPLTSSLE